MHLSLGNEVIQLAAGRPLALRGARKLELECIEGAVWLTLEGEPEDYLLAAGERKRIERGGLALVEGNPAGAIRLIGAKSRAIHPTRRNRPRFDALARLPGFVKALASLKFG